MSQRILKNRFAVLEVFIMVYLIYLIIETIRTWDNINHILSIISIIMRVAEVAIAFVSVMYLKKYYSYTEKTGNGVSSVKYNSKTLPILVLIFGALGAVIAYFYTDSSIKKLPKTCKNCGAVIENRYSVCKRCLSKDFTTGEYNIDNSKKSIVVSTMIVSVVLTIALRIIFVSAI
jgi:RNA polymerase subunit RPABC4/transcription elongation factor Spt4